MRPVTYGFEKCFFNSSGKLQLSKGINHGGDRRGPKFRHFKETGELLQDPLVPAGSVLGTDVEDAAIFVLEEDMLPIPEEDEGEQVEEDDGEALDDQIQPRSTPARVDATQDEARVEGLDEAEHVAVTEEHAEVPVSAPQDEGDTVGVGTIDSTAGEAVHEESSPDRYERHAAKLTPLPPNHARTHPERVKLVIRPLGCPLDASRLPNIFMGFFEHLPLRKPWPPNFYGTPIEPGSDDSCVTLGAISGESVSGESVSGESDWVKKLGCHGPPCPTFGSCTARFPNVQACWNPHLVDGPEDNITPPINCPLKNNSSQLEKWRHRRGWAPFDETCTNRKDFTPHDATALQMMRLEDVFVTNTGVNLNRTHVFVRNGCWRFSGTCSIWPASRHSGAFRGLPYVLCTPSQQAKYKASHSVHELPAVFNWAHQPARNFYHFLVELFPLLLVSAPLMPSTLRHLPVLVRREQVGFITKM
ncbi:unnamed protein product [Closterium sp. Yama58-4]|nr:unnamed protein product [Closterium sp. Yama58-4]